MLILFPSNPANPSQPEPSFNNEVQAAKDIGFEVGFFDSEFQLGGEVKLRKVPRVLVGTNALYRGWLCSPSQYDALVSKVWSLGYSMITSENQYRDAYELPRWYETFKEHTPHSLILPGISFRAPDGLVKASIKDFDLDAVADVVSCEFGNKPVIVKDWVKTQKHHWFEACYIQSANDKQDTKRVVEAFLRLQGDMFYGGLVFRQFVNFKQVGIHPKSRLPLVNEWRTFFWYGRPIISSPYWKDGVQKEQEPPPNSLLDEVGNLLADQLLAFVAVDVAQKEDGKWMVVEINDAGAAGIPDSITPQEFYTVLVKAIKEWKPR
ncbi:MAG: ATP-grasp domain-containing protein [Candidatus Micrarchaeota archaeon]|nr:ATP-grasp domain-containing protein [Candidatus Micrarchaeota archaeon]